MLPDDRKVVRIFLYERLDPSEIFDRSVIRARRHRAVERSNPRMPDRCQQFGPGRRIHVLKWAAKRIDDHRMLVELRDVARIARTDARGQTRREECSSRKTENRQLKFSTVQKGLPWQPASNAGLYNAHRRRVPLHRLPLHSLLLRPFPCCAK